MKFAEPRPYADPEKLARRLLEIANTIEPVQDGRIHIEKINWPFLFQDKGSPADRQLHARAILFIVSVAGAVRYVEPGYS
jgi:hypothetical protein